VGWSFFAATLIFSAACDGPAPPPPPRPDAGVRRVDAAAPPPDAQIAPPGRSDAGPRLPPVDLEVVLPYLGDPVEETLEVEGEVGTLDVFFDIDTTGSFGGEIDNLQAELRATVLPELRSRVDDVAFGVGRFEDFPRDPFGAASDLPFRLLTAITTEEARVANAVASLDQPLGNGADVPESGAEALYQIATGEGFGSIVPPFDDPAPGGGELGGVGFRGDALRVVVHVTDAPAHSPADYGSAFPDAHSLDEAIEAMNALGIRGLGIASGEAARPHLERLAFGTGADAEPEGGVCRTGVGGTARPPVSGRCPLVFDVNADGSGLAGVVVDAITDLLATVQYEEVWGETDDALGFVRHIEAASAEPMEGISLADARPMDGIDDTFLGVRPGTRLRFRAVLRNERIPPADYDQYFNLTLRVVGDGVTLLTRTVRVTVPRGRLVRDAGQEMDAGAAMDAGPDASAPGGG